MRRTNGAAVEPGWIDPDRDRILHTAVTPAGPVVEHHASSGLSGQLARQRRPARPEPELKSAASSPYAPSMVSLKPFAPAGISVPEVGLGTYLYQGGIAALRAGLEAGALFIDTAEAYDTEEIVGRAIRGMRRNVFVATKISARHFRRAEVLRSAEQSLRRLDTDYIDLYQLHWPNYTVPIGETMAAMEELVQKGMVRYIGVSNFSVAEMKWAQRSFTSTKVVSNQVRFSLVERTIEDGLLQYCEANQISVIAFSPLGEGLQNIQRHDPARLLGRMAAETGKTPAQLALNWALCHRPVVVIPKANSPEHVRENCGASGWRLTPEQFRTLSEQIGCKRRGMVERFARRTARRILQRFGRNLEVSRRV
jgi:diketogulonate reductase-like aldo/keto reductase